MAQTNINIPDNWIEKLKKRADENFVETGLNLNWHDLIRLAVKEKWIDGGSE